MQITGKFQANQKGFGFVLSETDGDVFIPERDTNGAMDGDMVIAKVFDSTYRKNSREGVITKIIERAHHRVVGRFEETVHGGWVTPDSKKNQQSVMIPASGTMNVTTGQKVVVELTQWPDNHHSAKGNVIVVLGAVADPGVDVLSVLYQNDIHVEFPDEVLALTEEFPEEPREADFKNRRDLRNLQMVTIDGEDARDLDDAVSLEILPNGHYRLGVHIADVSHYVKEGSALDKEAFERATSVYLPDRVVPMLPQALSNGLCSLTAKTPRLAFSVTMDVNDSGEVVKHEIYESVLFIQERMTYTAVKDLLEGTVNTSASNRSGLQQIHSKENDSKDNSNEAESESLQERYKDLIPMFNNMKDLAAILREHRKSRGSIDFSFDESKVIVDGEGHPIAIKRATPNVATQIIEEFMLLCNEVVSGHYFHMKIPFVYRVHEDPDPEKMVALKIFLSQFGYTMTSKGIVKPGDMQAVLQKIKGKPEEKAISTMMLRSMQKARYTHEHIWHFGLAAPYYSHFTSPIRRYPDLLIHRIMKETILGNMDEKRKAHFNEVLPDMTRHCSERERAADEAERECTDMKKAEYMEQHIGETFAGTVSGVTSFGLFVELENSVEGLIRLTSLYDDDYIYDEKSLSITGKTKGKTWRIGDDITIIVARSSPEARQIDFVPQGASEALIRQISKGGMKPVAGSRGQDKKKGRHGTALRTSLDGGSSYGRKGRSDSSAHHSGKSGGVHTSNKAKKSSSPGKKKAKKKSKTQLWR